MRRESPKMGCGHRPVGGLFALPRVPNEARVRLTLKRRFFFWQKRGRTLFSGCREGGLRGAARRPQAWAQRVARLLPRGAGSRERAVLGPFLCLLLDGSAVGS